MIVIPFLLCLAEYILSELYSEFCEDDDLLDSDGSGEEEETKMAA